MRFIDSLMARSMSPGLQDGWSTTMVLSIPWVMVTMVLIVSWSTSEMIIKEGPGWTRTALNYTSIFVSETTPTHQHHHHIMLHCSNKLCHCMSLIYYILESLFQFLHFIICILRTLLWWRRTKINQQQQLSIDFEIWSNVIFSSSSPFPSHVWSLLCCKAEIINLIYWDQLRV